MSKPTRTAEDAEILAATLKEGDTTLAALRERTGLDETRIIRATNLLKAERRIENAANGLLRLIEPIVPAAEQPQTDSEAKSDPDSIVIPATVVARAVAAAQTPPPVAQQLPAVSAPVESAAAPSAYSAALEPTATPDPAPASAETLASAATAMTAPAPTPAEPSPDGDALKAENALLRARLEAALEGQRRERAKRQRALLALKALKHTPQGEAYGASILREQIHQARHEFDRTGNPILKCYLPINQLAQRAVDMLLELERKHQTALETIDRLRAEARKAAAQPAEQAGAHG